jgi:YD repeat-containing protein
MTLKEAAKRDNTKRTLAGIGSPLHEAIVARFDARTVTELERDAMERLTERERRNAERRRQGR